MRFWPFPPKKPILNLQTLSETWKLDPEVIIKRDDLYARARVSNFGKPIFDNIQDDTSPLNPRKVTVEFNQTTADACRTPGTTWESSPESFPSIDGACDGTDTYSLM